MKLSPDEPLQDRITNALERAVISAEWQKDAGQFIPYPSTWLSARGWEDELTLVASSTRDWVPPELRLQTGGA